jgi:hypothetical protein
VICILDQYGIHFLKRERNKINYIFFGKIKKTDQARPEPLREILPAAADA